MVKYDSSIIRVMLIYDSMITKVMYDSACDD
jgi:hypothetical protein